MSSDRRRAFVAAVVLLAAIAASVALHEPSICAVAGALTLGAQVLAARGRWTPSGRFGLANALTLIRLAIIAGLPALAAHLPPLAFVALVAALFLLDGIDGAVARARGESSDFGARFDMECDALAVALLTLLLWDRERAPAWVLAAGLWRYVYAAIVATVPSLGEAPRSHLGRAAFFVLMVCLIGAFAWPRAATVLAAVGTATISLSFLYSLARAKTFSSSAAASSHARDDRRAA